MNDLVREVEAGADAERGAVEAKVWPLWVARQERATADKEDKRLSPAVRQWLELNDGEDLVDRERGIRAYLSPTSSTEWDIRPLSDEQILDLARAGLLTVRTKLFDQFRKDAPSSIWDAIQKTPGVRLEGQSWTLQVKPVEK